MYAKVSLMFRFILLGATIVLLVVSAITIGWSFFGLDKSKEPSVKQEIDKSSPTRGAPVATKSKSVKHVVMVYTFIGMVTSLKKTDEGTELLTDITDSGIPSFLITDQAKIFSQTNGEKTETSLASLEVGQNVEITIQYRLRQKENNWDAVREIVILEK